MSASKQTAFDYIDEKSGVITDVSDKIWDYAELSLREYKSGELYAKVLKEEGFTVEHPFDNIETAFRASYGSGKPVIGILAEYDALAGVGHACGHNLLGTAVAAAACALKADMEATDATGTIRVYGCPAEEIMSGKIVMNDQGVFNDLDVAITWHPFDRNRVSNDILSLIHI